MADQLQMWRQGHCQFGEADVKLRLICSDGVEYQENPLYLHSTVLRKSEFYETMFSERWSSDKRPFEVELRCSHSVDKYIKCFEFMYSSQVAEGLFFSTVGEALAILPVASELLFHAYIEECMQYLNAMRWTDAQAAELRALISSQQIKTSPDLAARLGMSPCNSDCVHLEMLDEYLPEMLFMIFNDIETDRTTVEKYIVNYFRADVSPAVTEKCKSALLKEFRANMDRIKSSNLPKSSIDSSYALLWLVRVSQRCDRKLFNIMLKLFCEDSGLRDSLAELYGVYDAYVASFQINAEPILTILINHFLKAMVDGDIITTTSFRHSFLTNWLDIIVALISQNRKKYKELVLALEKGIADLAETLPLANQRCIYNIWKETFKRCLLECHAFVWWTKNLHDAIIRQH